MESSRSLPHSDDESKSPETHKRRRYLDSSDSDDEPYYWGLYRFVCRHINPQAQIFNIENIEKITSEEIHILPETEERIIAIFNYLMTSKESLDTILAELVFGLFKKFPPDLKVKINDTFTTLTYDPSKMVHSVIAQLVIDEEDTSSPLDALLVEANHSSPEASYQLALYYKNHEDRYLFWLKRAAQNNHIQAIFDLAIKNYNLCLHEADLDLRNNYLLNSATLLLFLLKEFPKAPIGKEVNDFLNFPAPKLRLQGEINKLSFLPQEVVDKSYSLAIMTRMTLETELEQNEVIKEWRSSSAVVLKHSSKVQSYAAGGMADIASQIYQIKDFSEKAYKKSSIYYVRIAAKGGNSLAYLNLASYYVAHEQFHYAAALLNTLNNCHRDAEDIVRIKVRAYFKQLPVKISERIKIEISQFSKLSTDGKKEVLSAAIKGDAKPKSVPARIERAPKKQANGPEFKFGGAAAAAPRIQSSSVPNPGIRL